MSTLRDELALDNTRRAVENMLKFAWDHDAEVTTSLLEAISLGLIYVGDSIRAGGSP